ncbi:hypothetical protein [Streptococcus orisratti]
MVITTIATTIAATNFLNNFINFSLSLFQTVAKTSLAEKQFYEQRNRLHNYISTFYVIMQTISNDSPPPINPITSVFLSIFKQDKHLIVRKIREIVTGIIFGFKKKIMHQQRKRFPVFGANLSPLEH